MAYAYITRYTSSNDFPTTNGAFDRTYHGDGDVFVTKLNTVADPTITFGGDITVANVPGLCGSTLNYPSSIVTNDVLLVLLLNVIRLRAHFFLLEMPPLPAQQQMLQKMWLLGV
ncbi:hypothetical protein CEH05_02320 [Halobacillus halophilus]|nr:hypothetical protein [Halobacillus halophilus]ASF38003.1 hypothetical protein CEH05_02320 [Halobacillus halophilus]